MNAVASLPTSLEFGHVYMPKRPSPVHNAIALTIVGSVAGLVLGVIYGGAVLVFALSVGLFGGICGFVLSAGHWYAGCGQNAFMLTEEGFTGIGRKSCLDVPWHRVTAGKHVKYNQWSFVLDGPTQRTARISQVTQR
ncbi:MAG: hypothetical protein AAGI08_01430 [Bacteroidota bacterium]